MYKMNVETSPVRRHAPSFSVALLAGIFLISLFSGAFWGSIVMLAGSSGGLFVMLITTLLTFLAIAVCHGNSL